MSAPSPGMKALLDRLSVEDAGLPDPTTLPAFQGRALAALSNLRWNENLPEMAEARTVSIADMAARWVVPPKGSGDRVILYVHGGGWAFCSAATHEGAARRLALACEAPVLSLEYRLAPEHPFPAGLQDVLEAWSARSRDRRWTLAGDSAGANLALAAMLQMQQEDLPECALLFYGVYGADFSTPSYRKYADGPGLSRAKMMRYWDWYASHEQRGDPQVAPLGASDAQLSRLPPLYLNAAEIDPLHSDTEALAERLAALGRSDRFDHVEGVVHGFMQMGAFLPEAREAFRKAGAFFKDVPHEFRSTHNREEIS
ncbi:alpha/beta hydrolase [Nitratireductor basaltis]|uniref:Lipase protein n=1 Tax=Nitratireductor basaltis TaxID=472175 RepID=A0A084U5J6_9HYPH|nr:alpha/beta hydrolase [Nitratireductor basaltis]KFB08232.1 Lipase protein [Nitratireductor basaltis]